MSWRDYNEFIGAVREAYGLDLAEARGLYREMRDVLDYAPSVEDIFEFPEIVEAIVEPETGAYEAMEDVGPDEAEWDGWIWEVGEADERFEHEHGDDEVLYPGEELEISATTRGGTGR